MPREYSQPKFSGEPRSQQNYRCCENIEYLCCGISEKEQNNGAPTLRYMCEVNHLFHIVLKKLCKHFREISKPDMIDNRKLS